MQGRRPPQRTLWLALSLYRYFSFMVGVALTLAWPRFRGEDIGANVFIALALVSAAILGAVAMGSRLQPRAGQPLAYAILVPDTAIALTAVLLTNGLESGFLLYSLAPILTASLFMERRTAFAVAGISTLVLLGAHVSGGPFAWILGQNSLAIFLLYAIAAALVAVAPYLANLNLRQQLEEEATTEERLRLRRDIHDTLAQDIGFLNLQVAQLLESLSRRSPSDQADDAPREAQRLQESLQKMYRDIRDYLDVLTDSAEVSLTGGLKALAQEFTSCSGVPVELCLTEERLRLSPRAEAQLLAVAREAVSNVQRHARASRLRLSLTSTPDTLELVVEDDGQGFDVEQGRARGHYGLAGMEERSRELRGTLTITSAQGQGTRVRLLVPR